jgi:hypothetical protein
MKFYGYPSDADLSQPLSLSEVSFFGSEESLREIARFLVRCADEIANTPAAEGVELHFHLREYSKLNEFESDLVVVPRSK